MTPPIVLYSEGNADLFLKVEHAEEYLEPIDLLSGRYVIFDSDGMVLGWTLEKSWSGAEKVRLLDSEFLDFQIVRLRGILLKFLTDIDRSAAENLGDVPLFELVEICKHYASR